jgi:toxin secretion/phage lysis holin
LHRFIQTFNLQNLFKASTGAIALVGAAAAPVINYFYGGGRVDVAVVLLLLISLDWITGIAAALKDRTYSSEYGISGILRTIFILTFPALANLLDQEMGMPGVLFYSVIFGLIYHTFNSMTANAFRAGWGRFIPDLVVKLISSEIQAKTDRATKNKPGAA